MKLAIYIRTIKSAQGTERVSANLALVLAERGHSVDFLVVTISIVNNRFMVLIIN